MTSLLHRLRTGGFSLSFAGQGFPWLPTVSEHAPVGSARRRHLAEVCAAAEQLLLPVADELLARTPRTFEPFRWREGRTPPEPDLAAMPLSVPGIFLAHLAVISFLEDAGLDLGAADVTVGHSQGRFAVTHLQDPSRGAEILAVARLIGAAMPRVGAAEGLAATREGSPMVALSGATEQEVAAVLEQHAPGAVVGLLNSPTDVTVVGEPAQLNHALSFLPQVRSTPLPVSVAAHHPRMAGAVEQTVRWAGHCGLDVDLARSLAEHVLVEQVTWPADLAAVREAGSRWLLDLGPARGMAALSARCLRGAGVGVVSVATPQGERELLDPRHRPPEVWPWSEWAPRHHKGAVGTRFTDVTGLRPFLATGVAPFGEHLSAPEGVLLADAGDPAPWQWRTATTASELDDALRDAARHPEELLLLRVAAGTDEEIADLLAPAYHRIRALPWVLLIVRPGNPTPREATRWLTGEWSPDPTLPPMPCDAVDIPTAVVADLPDARREALRGAPTPTRAEHLRELWWRGEPDPHALSRCPLLPYFGELRDMTYLGWVERMRDLTGQDVLLNDMLAIIEGRFSHLASGPVERRLDGSADRSQLCALYPRAATTLLHPADIDWFRSVAAGHPGFLVDLGEESRGRWEEAVTAAAADLQIPVDHVIVPAFLRLCTTDEVPTMADHEAFLASQVTASGIRRLPTAFRRRPAAPDTPPTSAPVTPVTIPEPTSTGLEEITGLVLGPEGVLAAAAQTLLSVVDRPRIRLEDVEQQEQHQRTADLLATEFGAGWRDHFRPVSAVHPPVRIDGGPDGAGRPVSVITGADPDLCAALLQAGRDVVAVIDPWDAEECTPEELLAVHREHATGDARLWRAVANPAADADRRALLDFLADFQVAELHAYSGVGGGADLRWRARCAVEGTSVLVENLDPPTVVLPAGTPATPAEIRSGHALLEQTWADTRSVRRHTRPSSPHPARGVIRALPEPPVTQLPPPARPGAPAAGTWRDTVAVVGYSAVGDMDEASRLAGRPPGEVPAVGDVEVALFRLRAGITPLIAVEGPAPLLLATPGHARKAGLPVWGTLTTGATLRAAAEDLGLEHVPDSAASAEPAVVLAELHQPAGSGHARYAGTERAGVSFLVANPVPLEQEWIRRHGQGAVDRWRTRALRGLQVETRRRLEAAHVREQTSGSTLVPNMQEPSGPGLVDAVPTLSGGPHR